MSQKPFASLPSQALNASRPMAAALIHEGLLTPLHDGGLKPGKLSRAVDREHAVIASRDGSGSLFRRC